MKPLKVRTKVEAVFVLLLLCAVSVSAVTWKGGTDSTGQSYSGYTDSMITNTNGKAWSLTSTNLQMAIDETSAGGMVYVNANFTLTATITGSEHVVVDFQHHTITIATDINGFSMRDNFGIKNAVISVTYEPYSKAVIYFDGAYTIDRATAIENVEMYNVAGGTNGTGIYLDADADGNYISGANIVNFEIECFNYGILLESDIANSWVNENSFVDGQIEHCNYSIYLKRIEDTGNSNTNGNIFDSISIKPANGISDTAIYFDGNRNMFTGVIWDASYFGDYVIELANESSGNIITCNDLRNDNYIQDNSEDDGNMITWDHTYYMPDYPSDNNLTLYLPFSEEGGTTSYDRSPYRNDATKVRGNWSFNGKSGNCLDLSGNRDYFTIADNAGLDFGTDNFTIMYWLFPRSSTDAPGIIIAHKAAGANKGWESKLYGNNGALYLDLHDGAGNNKATSFTIPVFDEWLFVAQTRVGDNIKYSYNGLPWAGAVSGVDDYDLTNAETVYVGARAGADTASYNGLLDELRVYNRSLSGAEVRMHYLGGLASHGYILSNDFAVYNTAWDRICRITKSNDDTFIYGGTAASDDLYLYANSADAYPYLELTGGSNARLFSHSDLYLNVQTNQILRLASSGSNSIVYGSETAGDDLHIYRNSADSKPIIYMNDTGVKITDLVIPIAEPGTLVEGSFWANTGNNTLVCYINGAKRYYNPN